MSSNEDDLSIVSSKVDLPQSSGLSHHISEPSSSQQFNCPFCPLVTNEIDILESHIEVEHLSVTITNKNFHIQYSLKELILGNSYKHGKFISPLQF